MVYKKLRGWTLWRSLPYKHLFIFAPESRLPLVQINSFYLKTAAKAWNIKTGNKDGFEEMEHEFPFAKLTALPCSLPEIFRGIDPKSRVPFSFQPGFSETFCNW